MSNQHQEIEELNPTLREQMRKHSREQIKGMRKQPSRINEDDDEEEEYSSEEEELMGNMMAIIEDYCHESERDAHKHAKEEGNEIFRKKLNAIMGLYSISFDMKQILEITSKMLTMLAMLPNKCLNGQMKSLARTGIFAMMAEKISETISYCENLDKEWGGREQEDDPRAREEQAKPEGVSSNRNFLTRRK